MKKDGKIMKRIDDRKQEEPMEKQLGLSEGNFMEKEFGLNEVFLMKEPNTVKEDRYNYRFAVLSANQTNALFLHDLKTYPMTDVNKAMPNKDQLMCEFIEGVSHNIIKSQKLSDLCACDEFSDREIFLKGLENSKLKCRMKKFRSMHETLSVMKSQKSFSVKQLLQYERLLVCVQERDYKTEIGQTDSMEYC